MMNPNNGEVLALVGKQVVTNEETGKLEIWDYAYGTFTALHEAGSTVKMATLLTGYQEDAVQIGEMLIDEPLKIGSPFKSSLFNQHLGSLSMILKRLEVFKRVYVQNCHSHGQCELQVW